MTTADLVGYVRRSHYFASKRVSISPDTVYLAASWAQAELLTELRLLERIVYLTLVAGRETYQFSPLTVVGATEASPIVLNVPAHGLSTGDTVVVTGGLVMTGLNGAHATITVVDADHLSLDGSTGTGTYTASSATLYHGLSAAVDVKLVSRKESPFGVIAPKLIETVENERADFSSENSPSSEVNSYYLIQDDPLIIGFRGYPDSALKTKLVIIRKPLPGEAVSATVDPLVPSQFDKLMYRATIYHTFDLLDLQDAEDAVMLAFKKYEEEKNRVLSINAATRRVKKNNTSTFTW